MAEWRRDDDKYGVSVQLGTSDVPDDGRYHVVVDGEIILSTRVESAAVAEFDEVRSTRRDERTKRLRAEEGAAAYRAMRSASWAEKSKRDSRRSGPGGR